MWKLCATASTCAPVRGAEQILQLDLNLSGGPGLFPWLIASPPIHPSGLIQGPSWLKEPHHTLGRSWHVARLLRPRGPPAGSNAGAPSRSEGFTALHVGDLFSGSVHFSNTKSLDCYWVRSFDFNLLGNQGGFHQTPKKLNFLEGGQQQPRSGRNGRK